MTERQTGAPRKKPGPKPGFKQTPAQKAAAERNLARGKERKREMAKQAQAEGRETSTERWAKLLDGRLTVADLDDEEVAKMSVRAKDGTFSGSNRKLPSHLAQQFHQEAIKRANAQFRKSLNDAVKVLADIASDPDARDGDRIKAANLIIDRVLGKAVETVRIEDSRWDTVLAEAVGLDRDLDDAERQAE